MVIGLGIVSKIDDLDHQQFLLKEKMLGKSLP